MPHIVLDGKADIEEFWRTYAPLQERTAAGDILKTAECWLCHRRNSVLIDCLTVEKGISRHFYVSISDKGDRCTVHLEPLTQPALADSVKHMLAFLAADIRRRFPVLVYGKTNLSEFLRP
jgi:hypothetical protein